MKSRTRACRCRLLSLSRMMLPLALAGCASGPDSGTVVGNPPQLVQFDMLAESPGSSAGRASKDFTLSQAWMVLDGIRLRPENDCSGGADALLEGPLLADLLDQGILPEPPELELLSNRFCRLETTFSPIDADDVIPGTPEDLLDRSILIEGILGDGTPFQIASDFNDSIRIEPIETEDLVISEDATCLTLTPDIYAWVDVEALQALSGGGMIYVNEDENESILDDFEAAVEDGIELLESSSTACTDGVIIGQN